MNITELLVKSKKIKKNIDETIREARIPSDHKSMIAGGCFDVVLEHHRAVIVLISEGIYGSAFSLVRPIFETFVRGVWLLYCASDIEVDDFLKDTVKPGLSKIIEMIEKTPGFSVGVLSMVKHYSYNSMCSYTHGGWLQIGRRFNEQYIEANYSEGEIEETMNFANTIALLSAFEITEMACDEIRINKVRDLIYQNTGEANLS